MKMTSRVCFALVFDLSDEPAVFTGDVVACVPGESRSEFEVGRATSCDKVASAFGVLLKGLKLVAKKAFRVWPKRYSIVARRIR